jgi:hypothetical protein
LIQGGKAGLASSQGSTTVEATEARSQGKTRAEMTGAEEQLLLLLLLLLLLQAGRETKQDWREEGVGQVEKLTSRSSGTWTVDEGL